MAQLRRLLPAPRRSLGRRGLAGSPRSAGPISGGLPSTPGSSSYDVCVVGGGVIGSAVGYFLSERLGRSSRVAVVERDPTYQYASFARSNSCIRQQYTTPASVLMMQFAVDFLRRAPEVLACDANPSPDISFKERGYLFLGQEEHRETMQLLNRVQRGLGADVDLLDSQEVAKRFPWLNTEDLALGSFGNTSEGWFNPDGFATALRKKAQSQGVDFIKGEVVGFDVVDRSIAAVHVQDASRGVGMRIQAGTVVNCAGAWAKQVAEMAGCKLPVEARKRSLFVVDTPESAERQAFWERSPFIIDPSGVFIRPETSGKFICGYSRIPEEQDPNCAGIPSELETTDHGLFEDTIWPTLAHRIPMLEAMKVVSAWSGFYEVCTLDQNCFIGLHPSLDNFWLCNGFSGHGMMQAAPAARGLAEVITAGRFETLDLSCFSYDRVVRNEPIHELAIV